MHTTKRHRQTDRDRETDRDGERVLYQDNGTEEKVFETRTVFKKDFKEVTGVE